MIADLWLIARTELRLHLRERETLVWLFVLPFVFFYFLGTSADGYQTLLDGRGSSLDLVSREQGPLIDAVEARLREAGYRVRRLREERAGSERSVLLPKDFAELAAGEGPLDLVLRGRAASLRLGREDWRIRSALESVVRAERRRPRGAPEPERLLRLKVETIGDHIPQGFEQSVPGNLVMFVLLVQVAAGGALLLAERERGLLGRLASSPMSRTAILLGKGLGKGVLGLIQIAFAVLSTSLLFGVRWGPQPLGVAAVLLCWLAVAVATGLCLGNFARSRSQVLAGGVLLSTSLAALGGCWWPVEITPPWMQAVQQSLPSGWARNALVSGMAGTASAGQLAAACGGLLACAALITVVAVRGLRLR